jgi:hypothetical protein
MSLGLFIANSPVWWKAAAIRCRNLDHGRPRADAARADRARVVELNQFGDGASPKDENVRTMPAAMS